MQTLFDDIKGQFLWLETKQKLSIESNDGFSSQLMSAAAAAAAAAAVAAAAAAAALLTRNWQNRLEPVAKRQENEICFSPFFYSSNNQVSPEFLSAFLLHDVFLI